jgi:hypothetical protein
MFSQNNDLLNFLIKKNKISFKKFVSIIFDSKFSSEKLEKTTKTTRKLEMLLCKGINIYDIYQPSLIYGWLIKKDNCEEHKQCYPVAKSVKLLFSEELLRLLFQSYWNNSEFNNIKYLESYDFNWSFNFYK